MLFHTRTKASDIIRKKLLESGGIVTISLLDQKPCTIVVADGGRAFTSDKLNKHKLKFDFSVFDVIIDLLKDSPQHRAKKGNAHGKEDKVGYGKCTSDTVMGAVAIHYFGKSQGKSCFDPIFVLAAVMDWADVATNMRGYIQLKSLDVV